MKTTLQKFAECVNESVDNNDRVSLECKLGLWSVGSEDTDSVYLEAFHCWRQYFDDGEYYQILGGKSPAEKLIEK